MCYDTNYIGYIVASIIGLSVYYPLATFIYPMLQFNDPDLDIKFSPTYLIILSQSKLLITGIQVFLPYQLYLVYQLILISIIIIFIFIYSVKENPLGEENHLLNLWNNFGYFFSFMTITFGILNIYFYDNSLISYIYFASSGVSVFVVFLIHMAKKRKENFVSPSIKRQSKNMDGIHIENLDK